MRPLFFEWNGIPVLGDLDVPSYFLMVTIGFLVGSSLLVREARRAGGRVIDYLDLSLLVLVVGLVGSRLAHVFLEAPWIELPVPGQPNTGWGHTFCRMAGESHAVTRDWNLGRYYLLHPQMVAAVWNGGVVFYGGLIAGAPAMLWFCRRRNIPFWFAADLSAIAAAVGLAFGRVGCLLAGCCHGAALPDHLSAWGIHLYSGLLPERLRGAALYPAQTAESLVALLIAFVLYRSRAWKRFDGQLILTFFVLYSLWRPINEIFRADAQRGQHGIFTTSQWISLGLLGLSLALVPWLWRRRVVPRADGPAAEASPAPVADPVPT